MKITATFFIAFSSLVLYSCNNKEPERRGVEIYSSDDSQISIINPDEHFDSDEAESLNSQGIDEVQGGNIENAKQYFLKALEIEDSNPTIINNLGLCEQSLGNNDGAIRYFEKAIQIDSTYYNTYVNYCLLAYQLKRYDKSIELAEYVIQNSDNITMLAAAYYNGCLALAESRQCEKLKKYSTQFHELVKEDNQFIEQDMFIMAFAESCE